jgi:hypothetical protein
MATINFAAGTVVPSVWLNEVDALVWGDASPPTTPIRVFAGAASGSLTIAATGAVTIAATSSGDTLNLTCLNGSRTIMNQAVSGGDVQVTWNTFGSTAQYSWTLLNGGNFNMRDNVRGMNVLSVTPTGNITTATATTGVTHTYALGNTIAPLRIIPKTVANLLAAATAGSGAKDFVSDANATTFASVVAGGGANPVPVYSDGVSWRIG